MKGVIWIFVTFLLSQLPPTLTDNIEMIDLTDELDSQELSAAKNTEIPECAKVDLMFVIDTSGSVKKIFKQQKSLAIDIVDLLKYGRRPSNGIPQVGAIQYGGYPLLNFALNTYKAALQVKDHLSRLIFMSGVTRTGLALDHARQVLFQKKTGGRSSAKKVIILMTDGLSFDDPLPAALDLRVNKGVAIYVAALSDDAYFPELLQIAGSHDRVYLKAGIDDLLMEIMKNVAETSCDGIEEATTARTVTQLITEEPATTQGSTTEEIVSDTTIAESGSGEESEATSTSSIPSSVATSNSPIPIDPEENLILETTTQAIDTGFSVTEQQNIEDTGSGAEAEQISSTTAMLTPSEATEVPPESTTVDSTDSKLENLEQTTAAVDIETTRISDATVATTSGSSEPGSVQPVSSLRPEATIASSSTPESVATVEGSSESSSSETPAVESSTSSLSTIPIEATSLSETQSSLRPDEATKAITAGTVSNFPVEQPTDSPESTNLPASSKSTAIEKSSSSPMSTVSLESTSISDIGSSSQPEDETKTSTPRSPSVLPGSTESSLPSASSNSPVVETSPSLSTTPVESAVVTVSSLPTTSSLPDEAGATSPAATKGDTESSTIAKVTVPGDDNLIEESGSGVDEEATEASEQTIISSTASIGEDTTAKLIPDTEVEAESDEITVASIVVGDLTTTAKQSFVAEETTIASASTTEKPSDATTAETKSESGDESVPSTEATSSATSKTQPSTTRSVEINSTIADSTTTSSATEVDLKSDELFISVTSTVAISGAPTIAIGTSGEVAEVSTSGPSTASSPTRLSTSIPEASPIEVTTTSSDIFSSASSAEAMDITSSTTGDKTAIHATTTLQPSQVEETSARAESVAQGESTSTVPSTSLSSSTLGAVDVINETTAGVSTDAPPAIEERSATTISDGEKDIDTDMITTITPESISVTRSSTANIESDKSEASETTQAVLLSTESTDANMYVNVDENGSGAEDSELDKATNKEVSNEEDDEDIETPLNVTKPRLVDIILPSTVANEAATTSAAEIESATDSDSSETEPIVATTVVTDSADEGTPATDLDTIAMPEGSTMTSSVRGGTTAERGGGNFVRVKVGYPKNITDTVDEDEETDVSNVETPTITQSSKIESLEEKPSQPKQGNISEEKSKVSDTNRAEKKESVETNIIETESDGGKTDGQSLNNVEPSHNSGEQVPAVEVSDSVEVVDEFPEDSRGANDVQILVSRSVDPAAQSKIGTPVFGGRPLFTGCEPMDVLFLMDGSGSLQQHHDRQVNVVREIVDTLDIDSRNVRVAVVQFSGERRQRVELPFTTYQTSSLVSWTLSRMRPMIGTTAIGAAFGFAQKNVLSQRYTVPSRTLIILVSDGYSQDDAVPEADVIKQDDRNVIYAVGLGERNDRDYLSELTGSSSRVFVGGEKDYFRQILRSQMIGCRRA